MLLLSFSTQGRPLREQQEVAAAVIQRCYRKYKQVIKKVKFYEAHVRALNIPLCSGNYPAVPLVCFSARSNEIPCSGKIEKERKFVF